MCANEKRKWRVGGEEKWEHGPIGWVNLLLFNKNLTLRHSGETSVRKGQGESQFKGDLFFLATTGREIERAHFSPRWTDALHGRHFIADEHEGDNARCKKGTN